MSRIDEMPREQIDEMLTELNYSFVDLYARGLCYDQDDVINALHMLIDKELELRKAEEQTDLQPKIRDFLKCIINNECFIHDPDCPFYGEPHEKCSKCSCGDSHVCDYEPEAQALLKELRGE